MTRHRHTLQLQYLGNVVYYSCIENDKDYLEVLIITQQHVKINYASIQICSSRIFRQREEERGYIRRFSIGIQSFDNEVLEESGRQYNFQACVDFLRKLTKVRMDHNIFNFDFIAFGKFNTTRKGDIQLRDPAKLDFFQNFVESGFADSFSLYTLELFE